MEMAIKDRQIEWKIATLPAVKEIERCCDKC